MSDSPKCIYCNEEVRWNEMLHGFESIHNRSMTCVHSTYARHMSDTNATEELFEIVKESYC